MTLEDLLMEEDVVSSIQHHMDELLELIPEIKPCIGFDQKHPHHHLDVWNHTLLALSMCPRDFELRLVLLLHDIGKPFSYQDDEVRHFHGHPKKSREIAEKILPRFDYDPLFIREVLQLIEEHDTMIEVEDVLKDYDYSYKRYTIQKCDALAHNPTKLEKRKAYLEKTKQYFKK